MEFLRFIVAAMAGPPLSMGFIYLFSEIDPRSSEAMFNFTDRALQLGFEGAFFAGDQDVGDCSAIRDSQLVCAAELVTFAGSG